MGKIILASSSPRRADILKKLKLEFQVIPSSYAEPHDKTDFSYDYVENLALNKALSVAKTHKDKSCLVIGADTIVVVDNRILGKPDSFDSAKAMLENLSGKTHFVVTSLAVVNSKNLKYNLKSDTTYVTFNDLTQNQIVSYINTHNPYDKAGSYGIQELPDGFVKEVRGDFDTVVGLCSKSVVSLLGKNYD